MGSHLLIETNRIIKISHLIDLITLFSVVASGQLVVVAAAGQIGRTLRAPNMPREAKPKRFQMEKNG